MSAAENKEVIRTMWDFSEGSVDEFLNGFADDVRYTIRHDQVLGHLQW